MLRCIGDLRDADSSGREGLFQSFCKPRVNCSIVIENNLVGRYESDYAIGMSNFIFFFMRNGDQFLDSKLLYDFFNEVVPVSLWILAKYLVSQDGRRTGSDDVSPVDDQLGFIRASHELQLPKNLRICDQI